MAGGMKRLAGETAIYGASSIIGKFLNWMLVPMYTRVLATESDFGDCDESVCLDSIVDGDLDIRDGDRLLPVYEQKGDQASDAGLCDDVVQFGVHFRPVYGTCVQCADSGQ